MKINPQAIGGVIRDVSGLLGAASIVYGCWLVYRPAGYIVAGVLMIAASILTSRAAVDD